VNAARRPGPSPAAAALALICGAILCTVFFGRFHAAALVGIRLVRPAAAASLILLASLAAGSACLGAARHLFRRFARLPDGDGAADPFDAALVGVPAFGTLVGAAAWLLPAMDLVVLAGTLVLAAVGALQLVAAGRRGALRGTAPRGPAVLLLGVPVFAAAVEAVIPIFSPDELVYKLAVPRTYALAGKMLELPLNSHSYFPAALSLATLPALLVADGIAAKLVFFAVFLLCLRVIRRLAERIEPGAGDFAAAVVAWTPALLLIAGWAWAEWGMIGLLLLSYERWDRFRESPGAGDAAACAVALAGAAASKYSALPWIAVFAVAAAVGLRAAPAALARMRLAVCAAGVVLALGGFFYVRNLAWTGSPVAPFLLAGSPQVGHYRAGGVSGWGNLLRGNDVLDPGLLDDALGILLPLCVVLSPLSLRQARRFRDLFAIGAFQFVAFVTFAPMSRLLTTALVPLALLGGGVFVRAARAGSRLLRGLMAAGVAAALAGQAVLVAFVLVVSYEPLPYLVGRESAADYVKRMRDFTLPYAYVAAHAPPEGRVLLLGENRTFDLERVALSAGNLDGPRLAEYLGRFSTAQALEQELRGRGVTHVIRHPAWYRVRGAGAPLGTLEREYVLEVSPETDAVLAEFFRTRAALRYRDPAYEIYEVGKGEPQPLTSSGPRSSP